MIKNPTLRKCICCMEMKEKKELFRIVNFNGVVSLDLTGKAQGRGAYVCASCINSRKLKKGALNRALKTDVSEAIYEQITEGIKIADR